MYKGNDSFDTLTLLKPSIVLSSTTAALHHYPTETFIFDNYGIGQIIRPAREKKNRRTPRISVLPNDLRLHINIIYF
jgi:hypothetical protein